MWHLFFYSPPSTRPQNKKNTTKKWQNNLPTPPKRCKNNPFPKNPYPTQTFFNAAKPVPTIPVIRSPSAACAMAMTRNPPGGTAGIGSSGMRSSSKEASSGGDGFFVWWFGVLFKGGSFLKRGLVGVI